MPAEPTTQSSTQTILTQVDELKTLLMNFATGNRSDESDATYVSLRRSLRSVPQVFQRLPPFVRSCSDVNEFWMFIRDDYPTYQERRVFLRESFAEAIEFLEQSEADLALLDVAAILSDLNSATVNEAWTKALHRRTFDPDGAITAARTMLETVLKHVLDDVPLSYGRNDDLPKLWRLVAEHLNLTPEQHTAPDIKSLLGNCQAVVGGLANLRNAVGDAHGQGRNAMRPLARHAELAVNLSGTMTIFILATWNEKSHVKE